MSDEQASLQARTKILIAMRELEKAYGHLIDSAAISEADEVIRTIERLGKINFDLKVS